MSYTGYAVVTKSVENGSDYLLAASGDREVAEEAFKHFRQVLTVCAASHDLDETTYDRFMASIRAMRIISVSVNETEVL